MANVGHPSIPSGAVVLEAVLCSCGPLERDLNFCAHLLRGHQVPHAQQRVRQDFVALDQAWQPGIQKAVDGCVRIRVLDYVAGRLLCQGSNLCRSIEWGQGKAECYRYGVTRRIPPETTKEAARWFPRARLLCLSTTYLLVGLSVFDSFIVQVVLRRAIVGATDHRFHTHILQFRYQT